MYIASCLSGHWASVRLVWMPDSVFSAGGGRCSVEAWYSTALEIEEALVRGGHFHVQLFCCRCCQIFRHS